MGTAQRETDSSLCFRFFNSCSCRIATVSWILGQVDVFPSSCCQPYVFVDLWNTYRLYFRSSLSISLVWCFSTWRGPREQICFMVSRNDCSSFCSFSLWQWICDVAVYRWFQNNLYAGSGSCVSFLYFQGVSSFSSGNCWIGTTWNYWMVYPPCTGGAISCFWSSFYRWRNTSDDWYIQDSWKAVGFLSAASSYAYFYDGFARGKVIYRIFLPLGIDGFGIIFFGPPGKESGEICTDIHYFFFLCCVPDAYRFYSRCWRNRKCTSF